MKERKEEEFRYWIGGYYGVLEMDEYELKVDILKEIEMAIRNLISEDPIPNFDYKKEAELVLKERPLKVKLQDSLLILHKIDAPMELIWLIKDRLKTLK